MEEPQPAPSPDSYGRGTRIPPDPSARRKTQQITIAVAVTFAIVSIAYRALSDFGLDQTAALFVGLPLVLAIAVTFAPPARTVTGLILKTLLLGILMAGILVGETLVCMLIASPLALIVGLAVGLPIDASRRKQGTAKPAPGPLVVVGVLVLASLEGVIPAIDVPRQASVTVTRHVDATPDQVRAALARTPAVTGALPAVLRIGFPRPVAAHGEGTDVGDVRRITFTGSGHHGTVHTGDLELRVTDSGPRHVTFTAVQDTSRIATWLRWREARVAWEADGDGTLVSWTLAYDRELAPSWYFGPVQHVAVRATAGYLIDVAAAPHG